ncbi:MAG: hypothetical protein QGH42_06040 [Kiritimatiellia bacterium]|nr:hypothetical protein [Kiritimatiellia bacterium]
MSEARSTKGALLVNGGISSIIGRGLERIQNKAPTPVDILHDRAPTDPVFDAYSWLLTVTGCTAPTPSASEPDPLDSDAWAVTVSGDRPAQVAIDALSDRAQLYALYHIAECLAAGEPCAEWAISRRPRVPKRYAWPSAGNAWSPVFRPDQFKQVLEELPGLGINGVLITFTPTHGTHYGRETIPFTLTEDGVEVDHHKLAAFRNLMDELRSYGLDIHLFHQAFTPPPFTAELVREYYDGKRELPAFEEAVEKSSRELAEAIFTHLPQVDGLLHHSIECDWFWGNAVSIFPSADDKAAGSAFEAYLRGMGQACTAHGKDLMYWTHVSMISARQLRLQRDLLANFPEVMVVEDHSYPNNLWAFAPVMGHLAPDLKASVVKGRFGLAIDTVDGEYYGAGALPTAYPDPHIRCGQAAAELGAEMSFVRMNEQSLTPLGSLEDINAIHAIATTEQWWENPRPTEQLWQEWCERRFGVESASKIVSVLKKSSVFITKGVSAGHMPLIDHSGLATYGWQPGNTDRAWGLFAKPGELLVDKPYDALVGAEIRAWQVKARGVALDDFLRDSTEAEAAMREALREIAEVQNSLKPEDTAYLTRCFEDAIVMIEAVRETARAARANAVFLADRAAANRNALTDACDAMEACADRIETENGADFRAVHWFMKTHLKGKEYAGYGVPLAMRAIAESFRRTIDEV